MAKSRSRLESAVRRFAVLAFAMRAAVVCADNFQAANQLYEEGKFVEAKQQYEQLVEAGQAGANVFYNLGNANYRLGAAGPAMLAYERALALDHEHPEARANLNLLHRQAGSRLWRMSWRDRVFSVANIDVYSAVATAGGWAAIFCFALILLPARREKTGLWLGAIAGVIVAAYAGAGVWHLEQNRTLAIVIAKEADARLAPAQSAGLAGTLPAGSHVQILSERGDWFYCELPDAGRGWISTGAIRRVRPAQT